MWLTIVVIVGRMQHDVTVINSYISFFKRFWTSRKRKREITKHQNPITWTEEDVEIDIELIQLNYNHSQDHFWKKKTKKKVSCHFTIPKWNRKIDSWLSSYLNDSSRTSSAQTSFLCSLIFNDQNNIVYCR